MWHWLRKSVLAIDPLVRWGIAISCGLHLFLIVVTLVAYWLKPAKQIIINKDMIITSAVTLVIDPHAPKTGLVTQKGSPQTTRVTQQIQKTATTLVTEPKILTKKNQKKEQPKSKPVKKESSSAKATADRPQKKPVKPTVKEKPKKPVEKPKKIEKKVAVATSPQPAPTQSALAQDLPQAAQLPEQLVGPIMVARSAADAAALTVQYEVQQELLRVWLPPVGIEAGVSCVIKVLLGNDGTLTSLEIVKPSGMRLFDVSARAALQQAVWPRGVWGATLELCLQ